MARKNLKGIEPVIKSDAHCSEILRELSDLAGRRAVMEARLNARVEKIKAEIQPGIDEVDAQIARRDLDVKDYIQHLAEQGEFDKVRSRDLGHGAIGMRLSPPAIRWLPKMNAARVVEQLRTLLVKATARTEKDAIRRCITIKYSPNKDEMINLAAQHLAAAGAQRVQEDQPYYALPDHAGEHRQDTDAA